MYTYILVFLSVAGSAISNSILYTLLGVCLALTILGSVLYCHMSKKSCRNRPEASKRASESSDEIQDNVDIAVRASINVVPRGNSFLVTKEQEDEAMQQALYPSLLNKQ